MSVLIVGAGAAGLACGRQLQDAGVSCRILEARDRLGGRVWTWTGWAPQPVELGAELVHGGRSATAKLAIESGLSLQSYPGGEEIPVYAVDRCLDLEASAALPGVELLEAYPELAAAWLAEGRPDVSLRRALIASARRLGVSWSAEVMALLEGLAPVQWGADLDALSTWGVGAARWDDGAAQLRVVGGYGRLMEALGAGLEIRYGSAVEVVRWGDAGAEVTCRGGQRWRADQIVVTSPLAVLQRGGVSFEPALPAEVAGALAGLGAGPVNKVVLRFSAPCWPAELPGLLTTLRVQHWGRPGWGLPAEAPVLVGLVGGREALALDALGAEGAVEAALSEVAAIWGSAARRDFIEGRWISWTSDPWAQMGYSYVPVGASGLRTQLQAPLGSLHLAGEATSLDRPATVQGALQSGRRVAAAILSGGGQGGRDPLAAGGTQKP